jgi:hypothetical protein
VRAGGFKLPAMDDKGPLDKDSAVAGLDARHRIYWEEHGAAGEVQEDDEDTEGKGLHWDAGKQRHEASVRGDKAAHTDTGKEDEEEMEEESSLHLPRNTEAVVAAAAARRDAAILERCI